MDIMNEKNNNMMTTVNNTADISWVPPTASKDSNDEDGGDNNKDDSTSFVSYVVSDHPNGYGASSKPETNDSNTKTAMNTDLYDDDETVIALKKQVKHMNTILSKIHEIQERDLIQPIKKRLYRSQMLLQQQQQHQHNADDDDYDDEYDPDLDTSDSNDEFVLPAPSAEESDDFKVQDDVQGNIPMTASHSEELLRRELDIIDDLLSQLSVKADKKKKTTKKREEDNSFGSDAAVVPGDAGGGRKRITDPTTGGSTPTDIISSTLSAFMNVVVPTQNNDNDNHVTNNDDGVGDDTVKVFDKTPSTQQSSTTTMDAEVSKEDMDQKNNKKKAEQVGNDDRGAVAASSVEDDQRNDNSLVVVSMRDDTTGSSTSAVMEDHDDGRDPAATPEGREHIVDDNDHNNDLFATSCDCAAMTFLACTDYLGVGNCGIGIGGTTPTACVTNDVDDLVVCAAARTASQPQQQDQQRKSLLEAMTSRAIDNVAATCRSPCNDNKGDEGDADQDPLQRPYPLKQSGSNHGPKEEQPQQPQQPIDDLILEEATSDESGGSSAYNRQPFAQQPTLSTISEHYSRENLSITTPSNRQDGGWTPSHKQQHEQDDSLDQQQHQEEEEQKDENDDNEHVEEEVQPDPDVENPVEEELEKGVQSTDETDDGDIDTDIIWTPPVVNGSPSDELEPPHIAPRRPTASLGSDGQEDKVKSSRAKEETEYLEMPKLDRNWIDVVNATNNGIDNDIPNISLKRRIRRPSEDHCEEIRPEATSPRHHGGSSDIIDSCDDVDKRVIDTAPTDESKQQSSHLVLSDEDLFFSADEESEPSQRNNHAAALDVSQQ